jgi:murein DD-endopeptidase MepM/ murein hydrolase activator NlpD
MSDLKSILTSFHVQDELNPKIWDGSMEKMSPKVRSRLLEIAYEFIEFLNVDIFVSDVIMTGSLANYNWSKFSDVDLHILVDFNQFSKTELPLYEELFQLKKTIYNDKHDITIYGYEVELYVQNEIESHFSSGVYSVLFDTWENEPKKENVKIDLELIKNKSKQWMDIIDGVIESVKDESIDDTKKIIDKYKKKLKKYRTCGLEEGGEYSDENLVFKVLRRNGYIEKLYQYQDNRIDKELSLKESTTTIGGNFKTDLENGPKNHGSRKLGNWQSDNAWDIFAPANTVVNSYTNGTVTKIRDTGKNSGKIYGTQVSIKGIDGFPDIFYTHVKDVKLKNGDTVKVGDYIGVVSEWVGHDTMTHVHIGLPYGEHIRDLLKNSGKIFTNKLGSNYKDDNNDEVTNYEGPVDNKNDSDINKTINKFIKPLLSTFGLK